MKRLILTTCIMIMLTVCSYAAENEADAIIGEWYTEGEESVVEIYKCGDAYCGKIIWIIEPTYPDGTNKRDKNNPDEALRDRPIVGMDIVSGFEHSRKNTWGNGTIYDPNSGKTYSCNGKLKGNKFYIRGYVGVSFLGRTTIWIKKEVEEET